MTTISMPKGPFCQSCGLALDAQNLLGTDAAGKRVDEFCIYCYHRGVFSEPAVSCDEMIARVADLLVKERHLSVTQARDVAEELVPHLKRWRHCGRHAHA
jgi:hypothetical protein